jgi:hypothetical protein
VMTGTQQSSLVLSLIPFLIPTETNRYVILLLLLWKVPFPGRAHLDALCQCPVKANLLLCEPH